MSYRFITKSIHAYVIDYPIAIVLIAAPFVLKLGESGPVAMWLSVVTGVAALLLAALTDHPTGIVRISVELVNVSAKKNSFQASRKT